MKVVPPRRRAQVVTVRPAPESRWQRITTALTAAAAIGALISGTISIYYTGRSLEMTREQVDLQGQGVVADRYASAVEQLGSDQRNVRLGGIYSLERLMRESPADQPALVQVLSDFVREHAPLKQSLYDEASQKWLPGRPFDKRALPPSDVQAAVTVIGRRPDPSPEERINFRGTDLKNVDMSRGNFDGVNLDEASLLNVDLTNASLDRASFRMADMVFTRWETARARHANFSEARLEFAYLKGADLSGSTFSGTVTGRSTFNKARLVRADLRNADLRNTGFGEARMDGATLDGAKLEGADLGRTTGLEKLGCVSMDRQTRLPRGLRAQECSG